ncbi:hypothetical protein PR003_g15109 [Phytophthora rubi]|uniref:Uncharacterized protein n=2 Tax=Phytophthora TaxID=4783 RepID=A0A6A4ESS7_9STRA|nr:hypothetical protein PR002_g5123 [Phytophthora rubi]KAE9049104.1 hypothetical protein PR001_g3575 [Phytophthora rubi]KAE9331230.1 hypothetical protein PR003_g15109 [Phytophthora rubi]
MQGGVTPTPYGTTLLLLVLARHARSVAVLHAVMALACGAGLQSVVLGVSDTTCASRALLAPSQPLDRTVRIADNWQPTSTCS